MEKSKNTKRVKQRPKKNYNDNKWDVKAKKMASLGNYQDAAMDEERAKGAKYPAQRVIPKRNDPQWYYKQEQILRDVASFSFSNPLGTAIYGPSASTPPVAPPSAFNTIAGLMAFKIIPGIGYSVNARSPVNTGAQNIYTRVRYKNSGAANYDAPDLMLYYIAMSSLYSAWNWAKRIYGYASEYKATNWYKARAYAKAENVDLADVVKNIADYRGTLNNLANEINAFCVPAVFSYMIRQSWLFSNIYMDAETTKAQEYIYTPACFYKYDETSSRHGGILTPVDICLTDRSTALKANDIINVLYTMVDALQYSSDIGNMSGDTLKEFGNDLFTLSLIPDDYRVEAVYNKEVLTQIENAMFMHEWGLRKSDVKTSIFNIYQDPNTNFIKWTPEWDINANSFKRTQQYINFHWDSPTPADVMVATRFNYFIDYGTSNTHVKITECGSEVLLGVDCWIYTTGNPLQAFTGDTNLELYKVPLQSLTIGRDGVLEQEYMLATTRYEAELLTVWTAFDWCPPLYCSVLSGYASNKAQWKTLPDLRDWDVYTVLTVDNYSALNKLALQSMFNVPN